MNRVCIAVSEAIWTSVREGTELTEEELGHLAECGSCAETLAEAQVSAEALKCVVSYPTVPDCRAEVMDRIGVRRRAAFSAAWAYGFAVVALVTVVLGVISKLGKEPPSSPAPVVAMKPQLPPEASPAKKREAAESVVQPRPEKTSPPSARNHMKRPVRVPVSPSSPENRDVSRGSTAMAKQPPKPASQDEPTAVVYVTWETCANAADVDAYSYTVTDPATGEATACTIKREGSEVEIEMESGSASPEKQPAKESKIHETIWRS